MSQVNTAPTCTLCTDAKPRTFKNDRSLRAHHHKYHSDAAPLVFGPVHEEDPGLDVRNLQPADFERCRVSDDGLLAIPDTIQTFQGTTVQRATDMWNSNIKATMLNSPIIEYRKLPRVY